MLTHDVNSLKTLTIVCPCGCGMLTTAPLVGLFSIHTDETGTHLRFQSRLFRWLGSFLWRKPFSSPVVAFEFMDGRRGQMDSPAIFSRHPQGEFVTPVTWHELIPGTQ